MAELQQNLQTLELKVQPQWSLLWMLQNIDLKIQMVIHMTGHRFHKQFYVSIE